MQATQEQPGGTDASVSDIIAAGEAHFDRGELAAAVAAFRRVLKDNPDDVRANGNLGVVYWHTGEHENALRCLLRAHRADPGDKVSVMNLAGVYAALGQPPEALRLYNAFQELHPGDEDVAYAIRELTPEHDAPGAPGVRLADDLLKHAAAFESAGQSADALAVYQSVLALAGNRPDVQRRMGEIYRSNGQKGKAIEHLMQAVREDALDKSVIVPLCDLLTASGGFDAAIHTCETYLSLKPGDSDIQALLNECRSRATARRQPARQPGVPKDAVPVPENSGNRSLVERVPEMNSVLRALTALGVEVRAVLDIGVLHGTPPLMRHFPDLKHFLFEPIDDHFETIRTNYRDFDYELFHVALSGADGTAWQNSFCNDGSGRITHSHIGERSLQATDNPCLVKSQQVRMAKLDSLLAGRDVPTPFLLKIDVDGHEIPILNGAEQTLEQASVVIIEATAGTFMERAAFLVERGFALFDIVDFAYYAGVLHQVDIVFVRKEILAANDRLRPMEFKPFRQSQWYLVSPNRFGQ